MNLTKEEMLEAINDVRNRKINFKTFEIDEDVLYSNYENDNFKIIKVQETGGDEGDVIVAKYLYDGKYQLLFKYTDEKKTPIEIQCYSHQCIELATPEDIQKALGDKIFENIQDIETFEYLAESKNRGMQVLAYKNKDISIIIRNNQKSEKCFKITVEEIK